MKRILLGLSAASLFAFAAHGKLNVVATTPDLTSIAKEIGGDKIEITTLARPTEDPHFVDAKPNLMVRLNRADALIEGGAELEVGWLPPLLEGGRNSKLEAGKPGRIACNEGIPLLEIPSTLDRSKGDIHAAGNPHYMTDPANAKVVAQHICNSFCQLDSADCNFFKAKLDEFNKRLDAKMAEWQKLLTPHKGKLVVTYHNSWPYFARRFDLKMDLFLEPKPGIPPTPSHLAEVISKMKSENVKTIVVQPYQNRKTAEAVAARTGATVLDFPSFPNAPAQTYEDWMDGLVKSLSAELK